MPRARCLPSPRCCLPRIRGRSSSPLLFFFYLTLFATSLTFVFRSFSSAFQGKRAFSGFFGDFQLVGRRSPTTSSSCSSIRRKNQTRAPSALERKFSLRSTRIPAAVLKQALYDSKRTSPRSTRPLPSSRRRRRSAPTRTSSSLERRALNERLPRNEESSTTIFHHHPSASISWAGLQVRGRAGSVFASFSGLRTSRA